MDIQVDHNGWSAVIPGARFNPVGAVIGVAHFTVGSTFIVVALVSALQALWALNLAIAAFMAGVGLFGTVFAGWPVWAVFRSLHRAHLEVSGRSLRVRRTVLGVPIGGFEVSLAACTEIRVGGDDTIHLAGHRIPVVDGEELDQVVAWIRQGAAAALASPDADVPVAPEALRGLRSRIRGSAPGSQAR